MSKHFGKGLVICLVKFAEHREKLQTMIEMYTKTGKEFTESYATTT